MLRPTGRWLCFGVLVALWVGQAAGEETWREIPAYVPFVDAGGLLREPGCSGAPVRTEAGLVAADTGFSFFVREGDPARVLVALDGGGACWDANTCIGSAVAGDPLFAPAIDETPASLVHAGGLADRQNPDNPFRDFTQLFVPYCTADVFWGSADTTYTYTAAGGKPSTWTIRHRGFDNLLAVVRWLTARFEDAAPPEQLVIAGASAGGYGALLMASALLEAAWGATQVYVLADSANGVMSEDFYESALGGRALRGGAWGVERTVPEFLLGAFAAGPDSLLVISYGTLASRYPDVRFGQFARAWDGVQIFYYNVMRHRDSPERWRAPAALVDSAAQWTRAARAQMRLSAQAPNYRFYLAAGTGHTVLADGSFYSESSGEGVVFHRWVDAMLMEDGQTSGTDAWRNVSCALPCLD